MPVVDGQKSESEKFAGASRTYSIEALMGDGRALQAGTSHNLGQNFAKAFDIKFQARDKTVQHVWTTSWGVSTRLIGGVIMTHGDDSGLILPPRDRAVSGRDRADSARQLAGDGAAEGAGDRRRSSRRAGIRVMLDERDAHTPGWKFAEWELRGVPLRLEIGPKDIEKSPVLVARRDTREKQSMPMDGLADARRGAARRDPGRRCSQRALHVPRGAHARASTSYDEFKQVDGRPARASSSRRGAAAPTAKRRSRPTRRRRSATCRSAARRRAGHLRQVRQARRPREAWFAKAY